MTNPWDNDPVVEQQQQPSPTLVMGNTPKIPPTGGTGAQEPWLNDPEVSEGQQPVNVAADVGRSAVTGLVKGIPNLIDIGGAGVATLADETGQKLGVIPERPIGDVFSKYADQKVFSKGVDTALSAVSKAAGGNDVEEYVPQTKLGEYANLGAQGVATAPLLGGATLMNVARGATAGVGSGIGGDIGGVVAGTPGRIVGSIAGGLAGGMTPDMLVNKFKSGGVITSADVKGLAQEQYQKANELGGMLSPKVTNDFIAKATEKLTPQTDIGRALAGDTEATRISNVLANYAGKSLNLAEAQDIDEALTNAANKEYGLKGLSKDGKNIIDLQTEFRKAITDATPENGGVLGGKDGFEALKQGRQLWAQSARLRDIENIINKADLAEQPANAMRAGFKALANNPVRLRGYDKATQNLIKQAAKSGVADELLRFAGSRLLSTMVGSAAGAAGGGLHGAVIGGSVAQGGSMLARQAGQALAEGRANNVLQSISNPAQAAPSALEGIATTAPTAIGGVTGDIANQATKRTIGVKPQGEPWDSFSIPPDAAPHQAISKQVMRSEEGFFPRATKDTTGHLTVGTGFNLDQPNARAIWKRSGATQDFDRIKNGLEDITPENDARVYGVTSQAAGSAAQKLVPNYAQLGDNQKAALTSLALQLGGAGLAKFKSTLGYLAEGNGKAVENSILNSLLAKQTPARARREALMLAYDIPHEEADRLLAQQGRIKPSERKYL